MQNMRIIKKYPNRRLYDTEISSYITLDEVKSLVLNHTPLKVVDAKTDEEVTNIVLLQIINELETGHTPIFTTEILQNMIRFYGNPLQNMMSQFLEQSFSYLGKNPQEFKAHLESIIHSQPTFNMISDLTKRNIELFQSMTEQYFNKPKQKKKRK